MKFDQLTAYLIDHEIELFNSGPQSNVDMRYIESDIKDNSSHNVIEKMFYFQQVDKVIMYELNNRMIRIYDAKTMVWEKNIECPSVILAVEYISMKNAMAVSLSDRTIVFFDMSNQSSTKILR